MTTHRVLSGAVASRVQRTPKEGGFMRFVVTTNSSFGVCVPQQYRCHTLVKGRVFCTIPEPLLKHVIDECGRDAFDHDILDMEFDLAKQLNHDQHLVGYNADGEAFSYPYLARNSLQDWHPDDESLRNVGLTRQRFESIRMEAQEQFAPQLNSLTGYLGWLLSNAKFLKERDELFETWGAMIEEEGIPQAGPTMFGSVPHADFVQAVSDRKMIRFLRSFENFYAQWRLRHLVTRELPEPLAPQIPILTPLALLTHMKTGGLTYYQPDTLPIPGRDRLIAALEDVRTHRADEHLREWTDIVARTRRNKDAIQAYANIFILHHFWSQLEQRHPRLLDGRIGKVQAAFGTFLKVKSETVDKYRQRLRSRQSTSAAYP